MTGPNFSLSLDVPNWRRCTDEERLALLPTASSPVRKRRSLPSQLAFRTKLKPVDVFCYLKARFGVPNGFQELLRRDDSDNLIHWDYMLKSGSEDIYICGFSREVHIMLSERVKDREWATLVKNLKTDFGRVGAAKRDVQNSLEKWTVFPNKYAAIAGVCEVLHSDIVDAIGHYAEFRPSAKSKQSVRRGASTLMASRKRMGDIYGNCIKLSLLTPVVLESFVNMLILMLCKKEIRSNVRQYESFVRSQIDTKIFDLYFKCEAFTRQIDAQSLNFKSFKRIVDKRNNAIHGNIDPLREAVETVYFEGRRPLFEFPSDNIGNFLASLERLHEPETVIKDYEDMHLFLLDLMDCIEPRQRERVQAIVDDPFPGFEAQRGICGHILPGHVAHAYIGGLRFDDELKVDWQ